MADEIGKQEREKRDMKAPGRWRFLPPGSKRAQLLRRAGPLPAGATRPLPQVLWLGRGHHCLADPHQFRGELVRVGALQGGARRPCRSRRRHRHHPRCQSGVRIRATVRPRGDADGGPGARPRTISVSYVDGGEQAQLQMEIVQRGKKGSTVELVDALGYTVRLVGTSQAMLVTPNGTEWSARPTHRARR